jgi:hypothetical protein
MAQFPSTRALTGERRRNGRSWNREYATGAAFAEVAKGRSGNDPVIFDDSGALKFMHLIQCELARESNAILRPGALWDYITQTRQSA